MILQGDVFAKLPEISPGSVDVCVTSPPYWMLRSYLPKGHPLKPLELGSEKTPAEYIANMVRAFGLVRDCMADHATCWINVGDSYSHDSRGGETGGKHMDWHGNGAMSPCRMQKQEVDFANGNLCLIPQRLAISLQDDGWIVRSYVIWQKPAPMPQSMSGWAWRRCRVRDPKFKAKQYAGKGPDENDQSPAFRMKTNTATMREHGGEHNNGAGGVSSVGWIDCQGCKKCNPTGGYVLRKGSWRPTSSYEPILMLAKTVDYFCDGEPVKTPASGSSGGKAFGRILDEEGTTEAGGSTRRCSEEDRERYDGGANLRDVWRTNLADMSKEDLIGFIESLDDGAMPDLWRISAEPNREKHYASFPTELVRRCLQAGTSTKGYCHQCGKPWVRVIETKAVPHPNPRGRGRDEVDNKSGNQANGSAALAPKVETKGWRPSCKCKVSEPRRGLVLDPFCGSGRTAITARRLGLDFFGVELNQAYVDMAERILQEDSPLFNVS